MRRGAVVLALALALAPLGARGADLVVWWEKGFYPQEDQAVQEIIAAFEQKTGKQVELVRPAQDELRVPGSAGGRAATRFPVRHWPAGRWVAQWAYEDRLVDLKGILAPVLDLFDADTIEVSTSLDGKTGQRGLYALPMGRFSNHVHVWNSLLERAGFTLADIPKEWEAFWSFWCDQVQPAVRKALGRDDIWGVGLPMSAAAEDTDDEFFQFQLAYGTPWLDRDHRPQVDDPKVRAGMITALKSYTDIWRKGCTPPGSTSWTNLGNNKAFLAQTVAMTTNTTLSIPGALRTARPGDYYNNAATIDWPDGANGQPLVIDGFILRAVVFKAGGNLGLPRTSSASSPRKVGSPTGWTSPATASCRRCASWSSSRSGSTRATRTACARRSRS